MTMFLKGLGTRRSALAILTAGALLTASVGSVAAGRITTVGGVRAGPMTMVTGSPSALSTTLDGTDLYVSGDLVPITVVDARGSGAGWNLTVTATSFANEVGRTLPNDALSITGVTVNRLTGNSPVNGVTYGTGLAVPMAASAPPAVKFFSAATSSGMGKSLITPAIRLKVLAETYAGNYNSQITLDIAAGP